MAGAQEDFLYEDNFDAILAIIDADFLENDVELNAEIGEAVKNIPSVKDSTRYPCNFCDKVCLSKGELTSYYKCLNLRAQKNFFLHLQVAWVLVHFGTQHRSGKRPGRP